MHETRFLREIEMEARLRRARISVRQLLDVRFGPEAEAEFVDALNAINDLSKLSNLLAVAAKCCRLGPFRKALSAQQT
jgi:hypothetical protein